jgi:hypothetical protein
MRNNGQFKKGNKSWNTGVKGVTGQGVAYPIGSASKIENTSSQYKGVTRRKLRGRYYWVAQISRNYKTYHLGLFPYTAQGEYEAHQTYISALKQFS